MEPWKQWLALLVVHLTFTYISGSQTRKTEITNKAVSGTIYKIKQSSFRKALYITPNGDNHHLSSLETIEQDATPMNCGKACQDHTSCWSFMFYMTTPPTCTLLNGAIDRRKIIKNTSVLYYEIENQCNLNENLCNLGTCFPHFNNDSYTCHCPQSYTGNNCQVLDQSEAGQTSRTTTSIQASTSQTTTTSIQASTPLTTTTSIQASTPQTTTTSIQASTSQTTTTSIQASTPQTTTTSIQASTRQTSTTSIQASTSRTTTTSIQASTPQTTTTSIQASTSQTTTTSIQASTSQTTTSILAPSVSNDTPDFPTVFPEITTIPIQASSTSQITTSIKAPSASYDVPDFPTVAPSYGFLESSAITPSNVAEANPATYTTSTRDSSATITASITNNTSSTSSNLARFVNGSYYVTIDNQQVEVTSQNVHYVNNTVFIDINGELVPLPLAVVTTNHNGMLSITVDGIFIGTLSNDGNFTIAPEPIKSVENKTASHSSDIYTESATTTTTTTSKSVNITPSTALHSTQISMTTSISMDHQKAASSSTSLKAIGLVIFICSVASLFLE
ncbi:uncharacterized protein [Clytia hemisphaerica]|uniref:EGF-like domain-containing protein n=1 Tax=Clytia hemisphaerica TaxID=252671 RepID=A0A7M5X2E7_9CNID